MPRRANTTGLTLRALGLLLLASTLVVWIALGAHWGWTKLYVETERVDPITEIVYQEKTDRLVPGVEFLAAGFGGGLALLFASVFFKLSRPHETS